MRGKIERATICLNLYDSTSRDALSSAMHEHFADTFARYEQNRARVKSAREFPRFSHRDFYRRRGKQGNSDESV